MKRVLTELSRSRIHWRWRRNWLKQPLAVCPAVLFFFISSYSYSQQKYNLSDLYQYWILSEKESSGDTLVYRTEGNEKIAEAPMYLKFGGMKFFPEGQFSKSRWRRCGNDTEPPEQFGEWRRKKDELKMIAGKEKFYYKIIAWNNDLFKVVDLQIKK